MIHLVLNKFKCWDNLTLEIPLNKITLLKGKSGSGKTSILKSIEWVLYGEVKKVGPRSTPNAKTSVSLKINNIHIVRTKNPNKLTLINDLNYEDDNAQAKINQLYGEYEIWLASSCMSQMSHNYFLMSSNSVRMELLNKISFHDEDPYEYINKIDSSLDKHKTLLEYQLEEYKYKLYQYDVSKILDIPQYDALIDKINKYKLKELDLLEIQKNFNIQEGIKKSKLHESFDLNRKIHELKLPIFEDVLIDSYYDDKIKNMNKENLPLVYDYLKELKIINMNLNQYEKLKKELTYHPINNNICNYTLSDLQKATQDEKIYRDNNELFKKLDIDAESMDDYIEHLNLVLNGQERLHLEIEYQKLKTKLNDIKNDDLIDLNQLNHHEQQLNTLNLEQCSLQHDLNHLILTKDAIKCPYCDNDVLYKHGELVKFNNNNNIDDVTLKLNTNKNDIISVKNKINVLKLDKIKYEKNQIIKDNYNHEITKLENKLSTLPKTNVQLLSTEEKNQIYKVLGQLKSVKIVPLPKVSSEEIKNNLQMKEHQLQYKTLSKQCEELYDKIPIIYHNNNLNINILELYLKNYEIYNHQYQHLLNSIDVINKQLNEFNVKDNKNNIDKINKKLSLLNEQLNLHLENKLLCEEDEKLKIKKIALDYLTNKVNNLTELKTRAIKIECEILKNIVNHINFNIYDICQNLFEDPIKIEMNLYKKLKVGSKIKQDINFNIIYKGCKFDSILELSGGEADRSSLALTLGLNKLSSSPLVIFDESLKSLDAELKQDIIKTIKQNIHSTVIFVEHEGVECIVDYIIDVEKLKK